MAYWSVDDEITAAKLNTSSVIYDFTYGETIAVNDALYFNSSDGKVYKTDANFSDERIHNFIGFALEAGNANDVKQVQVSGKIGGFSSLTVGCHYYLSETAGAITATVPTFPFKVGIAISDTELIIVRLPIVTLSDIVQQSDNDEKSTKSTSAVKLKEIKNNCNNPLEKIRIKFTLRMATNGQTAYGRIYKNGAAIGAQWWSTPACSGSSVYRYASEDLGPFVKDDLIQIYVYSSDSSSPAYVRDFELCYTGGFIAPKEFTNQDP